MNSSTDFSGDSSCARCSSCAGCDVSRRGFLQLLASGVGVALLGGCGASTPEGSAPAAGSSASPIAASPVGKEFKIAGAGKLPNGNGWAFVMPDQSRGIVFKTKDGKLGALSAKCTHAGCTVEWQQGRDEIKCPCHGSKFDASGRVLNGPALAPLTAFKARKEGDDALISTP